MSTVTFNANDPIEKMICVEIVDDCLVETTDETFTVTVTNPTGRMENIMTGRDAAVVTVMDNDGKLSCSNFQWIAIATFGAPLLGKLNISLFFFFFFFRTN